MCFSLGFATPPQIHTHTQIHNVQLSVCMGLSTNSIVSPANPILDEVRLCKEQLGKST